MPARWSSQLPTTTVFLYEFVTGGGLFTRPGWLPVPASLSREGRAMAEALVADFSALPQFRVLTLCDPRFGEPLAGSSARRIDSVESHLRWFDALADRADWTLIVAPEIDGVLGELCERVEQRGARLLSPGSRFVALASDKNRTAQWLGEAGVPVPEGAPVTDLRALPPDFVRPAVLKPAFGAGSWEIHTLVDDQVPPVPEAAGPWRLEQLVTGRAASIAVLMGPRGSVILPAASQRLSDDGHYGYLGGALPLPEPLDRRARELGRRVLEALGEPGSCSVPGYSSAGGSTGPGGSGPGGSNGVCGYIGIDLILGEPLDGSRDYVIEVNPRITTSYIGLRHALGTNLAACMVDLALGRQVELPSQLRPVEFEASGRLSVDLECGFRVGSFLPSPNKRR